MQNYVVVNILCRDCRVILKTKKHFQATEVVFLGGKRKPAGDRSATLPLNMKLYDIAKLADLDPERSAEKIAVRILLDYLEKNKKENSF